MKISFDFDNTLSEPYLQKLAKALVDAGHDIWVLTSRDEVHILGQEDLYQVMKDVGIPKHKVIFTNGALKVNEYVRMGFEMHFDDMWDEVEAINLNGGNAVLVGFDGETMEDIFIEKSTNKRH